MIPIFMEDLCRAPKKNLAFLRINGKLSNAVAIQQRFMGETASDFDTGEQQILNYKY